LVDEYARLLLPPLLRLAAGYGIALEAHLQNCVPTFLRGVPHRLALRDFAGLRLYRPRLAARGVELALWPGSVVGTDDPDVLLAKLAYTALQANLGELVVRLVGSHALDEPAAWRRVRAVVDQVYGELRADPGAPAGVRAAARADHAFLTAPTVPHKALVRMRMAGAGDAYVPVPNPLR
jgi:siderophore synthetase component